MKFFRKSWMLLMLGTVALFQNAHALWPDAVYERIGEDSGRVLTALKLNDTATLARYVGSRGLRFSPYIYAEKNDVKRTHEQVKFLKNSSRKYLWGDYDGLGEPIRLNWRDYRRRFVWNRDYIPVAPQFDYFKGRGNLPNNLREMYRNAVFVEYFLPSSNQNSMDWSSLWLIWQPTGKRWFLSGIAHDQWTT